MQFLISALSKTVASTHTFTKTSWQNTDQSLNEETFKLFQEKYYLLQQKKQPARFILTVTYTPVCYCEVLWMGLVFTRFADTVAVYDL